MPLHRSVNGFRVFKHYVKARQPKNIHQKAWLHEGQNGRSAPSAHSSQSCVLSHTLETWRPAIASSWPAHFLMMTSKFRRQKKPNDALPSLNAAIDALDLARDNASLKPAKDAFHSTSSLLATTRVRFLLFMFFSG